MSMTRWLLLAIAAAAVPAAATPAHAQGKAHQDKAHASDNAPTQANAQAEAPGKAKDKRPHYRANATKAISVTRTVLERQGYVVVRVERVGDTRVIYYYRGNNGRGKGKGPLQKLVIRTVRDRVVFEDIAPAIMVDIDIKLRR